MSTQGVLVIRRAGQEKAMHILHDAYPDAAGVDVADLIKTTDLNVLYDCLAEYDDWDVAELESTECPDEPVPFSYGACRLAVKKGERLWTSTAARNKIRDSLFCEYAYVIDLDAGQLLFFVGNQTVPQEGNPYGTMPTKPFGMDRDYYPCRLATIFPIEYVRRVRSEIVADEMCKTAKVTGKVQQYNLGMITAEIEAAESNYEGVKAEMTAGLCRQSERLSASMRVLRNVTLENENRVRDLMAMVSQMKEAVDKLEEIAEILR